MAPVQLILIGKKRKQTKDGTVEALVSNHFRNSENNREWQLSRDLHVKLGLC